MVGARGCLRPHGKHLVIGGDMISTLLDLAGALLVILGVAVFAAAWTIPGALVLSGVLVLVLSFVVDRQAARHPSAPPVCQRRFLPALLATCWPGRLPGCAPRAMRTPRAFIQASNSSAVMCLPFWVMLNRHGVLSHCVCGL